jgi:hypothetical protein
MSAIIIPIIMLIFLATYDLARLVYYRSQVRSAATASVLAVVGNQTHWALPVPRDIVWVPTPWGVAIPIPYNGWFISALRLPYVDNTGLGSVADEVTQVARWTNPAIELESTTLPRWIPSPVKGVKIEAKLKAPTLFTKLFTKNGMISYDACAIAWTRPDYWWIDGWNSKETGKLLGASWGNTKTEPMRYYRLVECWKPGLDNLPDLFGKISGVAEIVITEHLRITGKDHKKAKQNLREVTSKLGTESKSAASPSESQGKFPKTSTPIKCKHPPIPSEMPNGEPLPNELRQPLTIEVDTTASESAMGDKRAAEREGRRRTAEAMKECESFYKTREEQIKKWLKDEAAKAEKAAAESPANP